MSDRHLIQYAHRLLGEGRVTFCKYQDDGHNAIVGVSWCSPSDQWHRKLGNKIALGRATCDRPGGGRVNISPRDYTDDDGVQRSDAWVRLAWEQLYDRCEVPIWATGHVPRRQP
jgi:hypothetical protein